MTQTLGWDDLAAWSISTDVEAIWDSAIYARESESGHLPDLYYLVSSEGYPEEENTWEPASAVHHLRKLISSFDKNYPDKPTATSPAINTAPTMAKPTVKPSGPPKQKRWWPTNSINKQAKKNWAAFDFYGVFGQIWVTSTLNIPSRITRDCTWLHMTFRQPSSRVLPFDFQVLCLNRLSRLFKPQS